MTFSLEQRRNRWLTLVSGEAEVESPIRITQRASLRVARPEGATLAVDFAPKRYGYLFVADGAVEANGSALGAGDSVRLYDVTRLEVGGAGELVLWDLPEINRPE